MDRVNEEDDYEVEKEEESVEETVEERLKRLVSIPTPVLLCIFEYSLFADASG